MGLLKKSPEDRAEELARWQAESDERRAQTVRAAEETQRLAFLHSPIGLARAAFERGDGVFQCSIDVMNQDAVLSVTQGSDTRQQTTDPVVVLNSVCREGWELITGSFVFVERGQQSRDKFLSTGQNVSTDGTTVGYYLFRRAKDART